MRPDELEHPCPFYRGWGGRWLLKKRIVQSLIKKGKGGLSGPVRREEPSHMRN